MIKAIIIVYFLITGIIMMVLKMLNEPDCTTVSRVCACIFLGLCFGWLIFPIKVIQGLKELWEDR